MRLSAWKRLWLAVVLPWRVLKSPAWAARLASVSTTGAPAAAEPHEPPRLLTAPHEPTAALQLLAILQREGRFIDFLQEDVSQFSDAQIGAAARVVHTGCNRGLKEYVALEPVRREAEDAPVVLEEGFDPSRTRITGNVVGEPPYRGRLAHHGWWVKHISLPQLAVGCDPRLVAPAQVELP